ncbi:MAG: hypothetical protein AAFZ11_10620, partial [Pseudomonadota bacterium]
MIGSEREALIDQITNDDPPPRYGGPLAMLGLVLAAWVSGRMVLWENPFPSVNFISEAAQLLAEVDPDAAPLSAQAGPDPVTPGADGEASGPALAQNPARFWEGGPFLAQDTGPGPLVDERDVFLAQGHNQLWRAALSSDARGG